MRIRTSQPEGCFA